MDSPHHRPLTMEPPVLRVEGERAVSNPKRPLSHGSIGPWQARKKLEFGGEPSSANAQPWSTASWALGVSQDHTGPVLEESAIGTFPAEHERDAQSRTGTLAWGEGVAAPLAALILTTLGHPPANPLCCHWVQEKVGHLCFTSYLLFPRQASKHEGPHWLYHPVGDHRTLPTSLCLPALFPGFSQGSSLDYFWALF